MNLDKRLKIRFGAKQDIKTINEIYTLVKSEIKASGGDQWSEDYPHISILEKDISEKQILVAEVGGICVAACSFTDKQLPQYKKINWLTNHNSKNLIIYRLVTHPMHARKGIAGLLLREIENLSVTRGYDSIRFNVYGPNKKAQAFYLKNGYRPMKERIHLTRHQFSSICFEKVL